jgi:HEAT repeat protein
VSEPANESAVNGLGRRLAERFRVSAELRPNELRPALLLMLLSVALSFAYLIGRAACDAIFLSTYAPTQLPVLYVGTAIAVWIAATLLRKLGPRLPQEVFFPILATASGSLLFAIRLALDEAAVPWLPWALSIFVDVVGALVFLELGLLAERFLPGKSAGRLLAVLETVGLFVLLGVGGLVWALVQVLATSNLLFVSAGLLWLSIVPVVLLFVGAGWKPPVAARQGSNVSAATALRATFGSQLLRSVAIFILLGVAVTVLVDYELKTILSQTFASDRDLMTAFFARILVVTGITALALHGLAALLGKRFGTFALVLAVPLATAAGAGCMAVAPLLWAALLARATHEAFHFTIGDATIQKLLFPVPRRLAQDARGLLERTLRPAAVIGAAALLLVAQRLGTSTAGLAFWTMLGAIGLLVVLIAVRYAYVGSLGFSLRRKLSFGRVEHLAFERDAAVAVPKALASDDPIATENALELAPAAPGDVSDLVVRHLAHPSARARALACDYLALKRRPQHARAVYPVCEDEDPTVAARAIRAYCAMRGPSALDDIANYLDSENPLIAAAAAAGLIAFAAEPGAAAATATLERLVGSDEPEARAQAAAAMGAVARDGELQEIVSSVTSDDGEDTGEVFTISISFVLVALMDDDDPGVRRAAVEAAGRIATPELLPDLLDRAARPETARAAEIGLANYGAATLRETLHRPQTSDASRAHVAKVLGRIGTPEAIAILVDELDRHTETVRTAVCDALAYAVRGLPAARFDRRQVLGCCILEVAAAYRTIAASAAFAVPEGKHVVFAAAPHAPERRPPQTDQATILLGWALDEKLDRIMRRIFLLLGTLYPNAVSTYPDLEHRSHAYTALASILDGQLRRCVLPLLEATPRETKLRAATGVMRAPVQSTEAWITELLTDENLWIVTTAIHYVGARKMTAVTERVFAHLDRPSPLVRETALETLEALLPIEKLPRSVAPVLWDEFVPIRKRVDRMLERIVDKVELDRAHGTVEEVFPS